MGSIRPALPQWTWDDLEAALEAFTPAYRDHPLKHHLIDGLVADASQESPRELLRQVLSAGWVMAQVGASAPLEVTGHHLQTDASG